MGNYFAKNLKYLRENKKLSQNKLGELAGVNQTTIARWESEEISPSIDNLADLSKVLHIDLPEMVGKDLSVEADLLTDEFAEQRIDDDKYPNLQGVFFKTRDGRTVNDMTEEQKQYFDFMIANIKKDIDKELDKE